MNVLLISQLHPSTVRLELFHRDLPQDCYHFSPTPSVSKPPHCWKFFGRPERASWLLWQQEFLLAWDFVFHYPLIWDLRDFFPGKSQYCKILKKQYKQCINHHPCTSKQQSFGCFTSVCCLEYRCVVGIVDSDDTLERRMSDWLSNEFKSMVWWLSFVFSFR